MTGPGVLLMPVIKTDLPFLSKLRQIGHSSLETWVRHSKTRWHFTFPCASWSRAPRRTVLGKSGEVLGGAAPLWTSPHSPARPPAGRARGLPPCCGWVSRVGNGAGEQERRRAITKCLQIPGVMTGYCTSTRDLTTPG